tara:strand:+ start:60 stop:227 length:168 start_codon:yes stop_codon:yes gene_type:complete
MTLWMPYSRDCFVAVGVKRPYDTFTLAYRFVAFETMEGVTPSMSFCDYCFGFQEH